MSIDRSLLRRRRRRLPRAVWALLTLGVVGGLTALWIWVFSPIFIEPREWHARQRQFSRAIREVVRPASSSGLDGAVAALPEWPPPLSDDQVRVLACAEGQVARGVRLSPTYHPLDYPWGDLPDHLGTSADVLIRCLRSAGVDLQQMLHIDRTESPRSYPRRLWANRRPDKNIDHRRMPNLFTFVKTYFVEVPTEVTNPEQAAKYLPGDLVFWEPGGSHGFPGMVGLVLDRRGTDGVPWVATVHPKEKWATYHHKVTDWPIMGHYRFGVDAVLERFLEANPGAVLTPRPPSLGRP